MTAARNNHFVQGLQAHRARLVARLSSLHDDTLEEKNRRTELGRFPSQFLELADAVRKFSLIALSVGLDLLDFRLERFDSCFGFFQFGFSICDDHFSNLSQRSLLLISVLERLARGFPCLCSEHIFVLLGNLKVATNLELRERFFARAVDKRWTM
jgi:hypothetical protein